MTEGRIGPLMIKFAIPIFIGNLFQQLYNTVDALLVGNFVGSAALGAVSSTGMLIYLLISFFEGLAVGAGVAISRYFGARDYTNTSLAIHTTTGFSLIIGLVLTVGGVSFAPVILKWMQTPEDILPLATSYIRIYFSGGLALVLYNTFRGIMQAVGDSKRPLYYLIICSAVNVVLDLLFIRVFHMGVDGAAIATVISQLLSAVLCFIRLLRTKDVYRIQFRSIRIHPSMLSEIVHYGIPTGIQNSVIGLANVLVQSNINLFGTMAVAGCGAYSKIEGFVFLPITSFVLALTTFVSQNLGAEEYDRAGKGAKFGILSAIGSAVCVGALTTVFAPQLIRMFTNEPEAIAFGVQKARICAPFFLFLALSHSIAAILRGAGKPVIPMIIMLVCWCLIRITILSVFVPMLNSITIVNWVYPITWFLSSAAFLYYFKKSDWKHGFEKFR